MPMIGESWTATRQATTTAMMLMDSQALEVLSLFGDHTQTLREKSIESNNALYTAIYDLMMKSTIISWHWYRVRVGSEMSLFYIVFNSPSRPVPSSAILMFSNILQRN